MKSTGTRDMARFACTTMIVGKDATIDGSVIVAHSDDDVTDTRLIRVPGQRHKKDTQRPVYYDNCSLGPNKKYNSTDIRRYIGTSRGPAYDTKDHPRSKPLGHIPQTSKTYAYFDGNYGVMNEHNLMIGECTCGAKVHPEPDPQKRIFYSAELSRVALERCKTARQAIELISSLIAEYGYYGTGETLLIGDGDEGWVMEMCGYDLDGEDGIWVAQRVPDDQFFVAANEFRIRDIHINSKDQRKKDNSKLPCYYNSAVRKGARKENDDLLYSANLFRVCEKLKWIKKGAATLDWLPTVSHGEYSHPYYSLRRVWRAFSKVAPCSFLPVKVANGYTRAYPFSLKPEEKLSVLDVAAIYRDHYEGTEFDMTTGPAAGPFRNPVRYEGNPDQGDSFNLNKYKVDGAWERPLSIYRCGMLWINQAKGRDEKKIGFTWLGLDRPVANCLMPLHSKLPQLPKSLETMNLLNFKFQGESAWWAFNFVANYANLNFEYMMKEVTALQSELEMNAWQHMDEILQSGDTDGLDSYCEKQVKLVVKKWWKLATRLIVKFNNGCLTTGPNSIMQPIDYPKEWLRDGGFYQGPTEY